MSKYESMEAAVEAQTAKAAQVKEAKTALLNYFKENKLKKTEDYSEDPKHGKKVNKLEARVDKYSDELITINEAVKKLKKPGKEKSDTPRNLKYEYPDDVKTADQRKKYRIEQRKLANAAEGGKPAKTKSKKTEKSQVEEVEAKPAKKAKTSKSQAKSTVTEEPKAAKAKSKSRKKRRETSEEDDD